MELAFSTIATLSRQVVAYGDRRGRFMMNLSSVRMCACISWALLVLQGDILVKMADSTLDGIL